MKRADLVRALRDLVEALDATEICVFCACEAEEGCPHAKKLKRARRFAKTALKLEGAS